MTTVELDVPEPLRGCIIHSETICVRECCGIDAISNDPELVAAWGRQVGYQTVLKALAQVEELIARTQDRSHHISSQFLNACTYGDGEGGRKELLSFLQAFETALRSRPMNEVLTRAEMEAQFDGEWVLIGNPELDENLEVLSGLVVSHGLDPEAVYAEATNQNIRRWASLCFAPIPETSILLNIWA